MAELNFATFAANVVIPSSLLNVIYSAVNTKEVASFFFFFSFFFEKLVIRVV